MNDKQKDWLGEIFLWSLAIALIGINAITDWKLAGQIAAVAMYVFGLMCAAMFLFKIIDFFGELRTIRSQKR